MRSALLTFISLFFIVNIMRRETSQSNLQAEICSSWTEVDNQARESKSVAKFVSFLRDGNQLQPALINNNFKHYTQGLMSFSIPFIILMTFSQLSLTVYLFCCLRGKRCSGCLKSQKTKYEEEDLKYPLLMAISMSLITMGAIIMGLIKSKGLEDGFHSSKCNSYALIERFLEGDSSNGWAGLTGNLQSLDELRVLFRITMNQLSSTFSETDFSLDKIYAINNQIYKSYQDQQIQFSPDPSNPNQQISSIFMTNIGPPDRYNTLTQNSQSVINTYLKPVNVMILNMKEKFLNLSQQETTIENKVLNASVTLGEIAQQNSDIYPKLQYYFSYPDEYISAFGQNYQAAYSLISSSVILIFVGSIFTHKRKFNLRYVMHAGWFTQSIFMSLGFGLTAVVLPMIIVLVEMSQTMEDMSINKRVLSKSVGFVPPKLLNVFGVCLFDQGDLASYLRINTELYNLSSFLEQLNAINLTAAVNQMNAIDSNFLIIQKSIDEQIEGQIKDSWALNLSNPYNSLQNFNLKVKDCNQSSDEWAYDYLNCTIKNLFNRSSNQSTIKPTCIQVNELTNIQFQKRYQNYSWQTTSLQNLSGHHKALFDYDQARRKLFLRLQDDQQNLVRSTSNYKNNLANILWQIQEIQSQSRRLFNLIKSLRTSQLDCSYLKESFQVLSYSFGVEFVTPLFFVMISILFISFTMMCSTYYGFKGITRALAFKEQNEVKVHPARIESSVDASADKDLIPSKDQKAIHSSSLNPIYSPVQPVPAE